MANVKRETAPAILPVTMTIKETAEALRCDQELVVAWSRRDEDPLPLRIAPSKRRGWFITSIEFMEWVERNCATRHDRERGLA